MRVFEVFYRESAEGRLHHTTVQTSQPERLPELAQHFYGVAVVIIEAHEVEV